MFLILFRNCDLMVIILPFSMPAVDQGGQKRVLNCLGLEFFVIVSCPVWCWEPNSGPLEKQPLPFLSHQTISPATSSFCLRQDLTVLPRQAFIFWTQAIFLLQLLLKPASRDWQRPGLRVSSGSLRDLARPPDTLVSPSNRSHVPG